MMSILKHKGMRPTYELSPVKGSKYTLFWESFPEGGGRLWHDRMLKSGCGNILSDEKRMDDLIYCKHCDEWFISKQFEEVNS